MISNRLLIIMGVVILAGFISLIFMIRQRKITLRYALLWIAMIIGLACLIFIPGSLKFLSRTLGIYSEINMVFFLGFLFSIILSFMLTVSASRNSEKIRKLTQQMGIYEHEINNKDNESKSED